MSRPTSISGYRRRRRICEPAARAIPPRSRRRIQGRGRVRRLRGFSASRWGPVVGQVVVHIDGRAVVILPFHAQGLAAPQLHADEHYTSRRARRSWRLRRTASRRRARRAQAGTRAASRRALRAKARASRCRGPGRRRPARPDTARRARRWRLPCWGWARLPGARPRA